MQYCIRFNGHITWEGRMNGLPEMINAYLIFDGDDKAAIDGLIENQSAAFIRSQAFYAQKDQGQIIDLRAAPSDRMLVPFHNISFIDVDVFSMSAELPEADKSGIQRLKDGTEALKN